MRPEETAKIAEAVNILGNFCGPRDIDELTTAALEDKFHISRVDVAVLFGGSTLFGLADEFVDGRIFIDVGLLAVVDSHGSMGRFCPGKKGKLIVRQGKVLGDKGKTCPGQGKIVGFTGGSTDNVVQFVIDGDNVMSPGKYML